MATTLIILAITVVFFIYGKIRTDLVAFCAMLALTATGVLTPAEALSNFGDPLVFVIIGLFVVSAGVFRTGLANIIGSKILMLAGNNETLLYFLMMIVATFMGAFVTGTGTVALFIPIIVSMSLSKNISVSRFLMPLAFAAGIGSSYTMINTSNLAIERILMQQGHEGFKFFSLAPLGLIASVVAITLLGLLSRIFLSGRRYGESQQKESKSFQELVEEYQIADKTFFARLSTHSLITGCPLKELKLTHRYGISLVQVIRKEASHSRLRLRRRQPRHRELAGPNTVLQSGDIIEILGPKAEVDNFIEENGLEPVFNEKAESMSLGIAEVLLMPTSKLVGLKVKDSKFRENYRVTILAINRKGQYMTEDLKEETMNSGDAILVQGAWPDLSRLDEDYVNVVMVGKPLQEAAKMPIDHKAPVAGLILAGMIFLIATETLPTVTAVLLAAVLMIATGCIRNVAEGYASINWSAVVMIASMMPMSLAFHKTGIDTLISQQLQAVFGSMGPYALLAGLYFSISLLTFVLNGTTLVILFAPIGYQVAVTAGVSPYPFMIAVAAATNLYFASPFSSVTNMMVATAGRYKFSDFIKVGLPLQILLGIIIIIVIPLLYPF